MGMRTASIHVMNRYDDDDQGISRGGEDVKELGDDGKNKKEQDASYQAGYDESSVLENGIWLDLILLEGLICDWENGELWNPTETSKVIRAIIQRLSALQKDMEPKQKIKLEELQKRYEEAPPAEEIDGQCGCIHSSGTLLERTGPGDDYGSTCTQWEQMPGSRFPDNCGGCSWCYVRSGCATRRKSLVFQGAHWSECKQKDKKTAKLAGKLSRVQQRILKETQSLEEMEKNMLMEREKAKGVAAEEEEAIKEQLKKLGQDLKKNEYALALKVGELEAAEREVRETQKKALASEQKLDEKDDKIELLTKQIQKAKGAAEATTEQQEAIQEQLKKMEELLKENEKALSLKVGLLKAAEAEKTDTQNKALESEEKLRDKDAEIDRLKKNIQTSETERESLTKELSNLEKTRAGSAEELQALNEDLENSRKEEQSLKQKLQQEKEKVEELRTQAAEAAKKCRSQEELEA